MKLENQVVSLELAKKLKELGFEQESLFYYYGILINSAECKSATPNFEIHYGAYNEEREYRYYNLSDRCSAYTVAELGEMLPSEIYGGGAIRFIKNIDGVGKVKYGCLMNDFDNINKEKVEIEIYIKECWEETEADARAKMLIYLKENNLI